LAVTEPPTAIVRAFDIEGRLCIASIRMFAVVPLTGATPPLPLGWA
jgi:hypothetical protein